MAQNPIQWFPGHMAKTRRIIKECLSQVDIVIELLDARIPYSSRNPETQKIVGSKPLLTLLTKASLADPEKNKLWLSYYNTHGSVAILFDSVAGIGMNDFTNAINTLLKEKIERYKIKGMEGRRLKAMIIGIPNVGKSSFINKLAKGKKAKVENRPGVTLTKQWITTDIGLDLMDTPGVLWPKFEDENVGQNLALTGAIRDAILDTEELAMTLCTKLMECAPREFTDRYKISPEEAQELDSYDLFELVGKKRGLLMSGGVINHERCADMLLEEFRSAKIGRITLEVPNAKL
jgi:ribosome biogenesis GTPase A